MICTKTSAGFSAEFRKSRWPQDYNHLLNCFLKQHVFQTFDKIMNLFNKLMSFFKCFFLGIQRFFLFQWHKVCTGPAEVNGPSRRENGDFSRVQFRANLFLM